jgi:hypothetical protein
MATAASLSEPYRKLTESGLALGRSAMSIWQEMVDQHGFTGAYESVKRFVRKLRAPVPPDHAPSSPLHPAKKRTSITAPAPRSAIRLVANTAARTCTC